MIGEGAGGGGWHGGKALSRGLVIENGATSIFDVEYRRNVSMRPDEPRRHASAGRSTVFRRSKIRLPRSNGARGEEEGREKNSFPIDFYCLVIVRRPRVPLLLLVSLNSYAIFGNILIGSEIIIYFIALRRSYCWKCFVSFVERELCSRSVGDDLQLIDELFPLF